MFSKGDILTVNGKQYTVIDHKNVEVGKFEIILRPGIWEEEEPGVWIERMIFKRGAIKEYFEINPDIGRVFRWRDKNSMKDSRAGVFSIGYHSSFIDNLCRPSTSGGSMELPKKKTNFDCITESPEKLAKFLDKHKIRPCGNEVICEEECPCFKKCAQGNIPTDYEIWIAWLKREG